MQNPNPLEQQIKKELCIEIEASERNYAIVKDALSRRVTYQPSEIKGIIQSYKDNLSKVNSLFMVLSQIQAKGTQLSMPINPLLQNLDYALVLIEAYPQQNPSSFLQLALALSNIKIENVMSLLSILKKLL
jgi:hypothetical protein